jgi:hypothetical protein
MYTIGGHGQKRGYCIGPRGLTNLLYPSTGISERLLCRCPRISKVLLYRKEIRPRHETQSVKYVLYFVR